MPLDFASPTSLPWRRQWLMLLLLLMITNVRTLIVGVTACVRLFFIKCILIVQQ